MQEMMNFRKSRFLLTLCLILVLCSCGLFEGAGNQTPAVHILFIGNSYTYINNGVDRKLKGMAPTSRITRVAKPGYTLADHWNDSSALKAIRKGGWEVVVLQEQSQTPVIDQVKFYDYVRKFDKEIKQVGAQTILFMTWERPDSVQYGVTTDNLAQAYRSIGWELGDIVAPVGLAFRRSLEENPELILNTSDGHPTNLGTYLAACVLYETIFGESPVGNPYSDSSITMKEREFLQQIAAKIMGY
jgi:hypothetical protein